MDNDTSLEEKLSDDTSDISSEDICKELRLTAETLYKQTNECNTLYKEICEKIAAKSSLSSSYILLPKTTHVKKWLRTLDAPQEFITYNEFLELFFDLYEREGRLDFATRSLVLRSAEAKIFELEAETPVSIYRFLGKLPSVFI